MIDRPSPTSPNPAGGSLADPPVDPSRDPNAIATAVIAFVAGLVMAWVFDWKARDLMWSLWLSSLVVGYFTIVMMIAAGAHLQGVPAASIPKRWPMVVVGGLFMLLFFTFHFGMFHFVHSVFLNFMFPIEGAANDAFPGPGMYGEVVARYWPFILITGFAQWRDIFGPPGPNALMKPYGNVVRMHILILFFGFISFIGLENFFVYAIVYAAYFIPLQLFIKPGDREIVGMMMNARNAKSQPLRAADDERDDPPRNPPAKSAGM